ncbi:hypothetical protein SMSP2_01160 [Limihaloglobus sulfuriphilus]|uniref:Ice-binding protein C-terminal domain-containing protein n=1 Tax=Limihaloglobus sulfuriphilus TaxID=1851148 RepID=A0A1Q2ME33_9BACT|nr:DUF4465 domain-containing protein [Limihaloglobus sulfuriphilus]AQQ70798.1 hypothetical protein SMSP2_01160 [Limihaloglobus sulfuriphilus]
MNKMNKLTKIFMVLNVITILTATASAVIDLEDVGAALAPESHWVGEAPDALYTPVERTFSSGDAGFNQYLTDWGSMVSWSGFTYSNKTDTTTEGYTNDTSAYAETPGNTYGICYVDGYSGTPEINFNAESVISGVWITNTTYAYLSMLNGDGLAKKFGGDSGNDPDWLKLTITGTGNESSESLDFMLADFTFEDNSRDYIIDTWTWLDLSSLGQISKLTFAMSSTDNNDYGMVTPSYFALDNINGSADAAPVPEPAAIALLGLGAFLAAKRKK